MWNGFVCRYKDGSVKTIFYLHGADTIKYLAKIYQPNFQLPRFNKKQLVGITIFESQHIKVRVTTTLKKTPEGKPLYGYYIHYPRLDEVVL